MKRKYFAIACCAIMVVAFTATAGLTPPMQSKSSAGEMIIDTTSAEPNFDLKAALGEDVLQQLANSSDKATVSYNGQTGKTTIKEADALNLYSVAETAPYIPDGLEIAVQQSSRAVIGTDNRTEITNVNAYPYCTMALLRVTYSDGTVGLGSGTFVGSTTILTAGHVIYSQTHGWASSVTVYPGGTNSDFGTATTSNVASVNAWVSDANWDYDYGVVNISNSLGTGYMGTRALVSSALQNAAIWDYGYSGDKSYGTLWYDEGDTGSVYTRRFLHNADTYGGNSGGPVVDTSDYEYIIGVHSDQYNSSYNIATRVTSEVVEFVRGYIS